MHLAFYIVLGHAALAIVSGWLYFRRYQITRPPIGVFNLMDVMFMLVAIILIPFVYLALPAWLAAGILSLAILSILHLIWEPILHARWAIWLTALTLLGADIGAALAFGARSTPFFAINNVVIIMSVIGATNLWAQSGMKARDAAVLAGTLAVYDFIATSQLPLMDDLISRLAGAPLAPLIAWNLGEGLSLGVGLGDMLLAALIPLVMRKAFGRSAGIVAMILNLIAIGIMLAVLDLGILRITLRWTQLLGQQ